MAKKTRRRLVASVAATSRRNGDVREGARGVPRQLRVVDARAEFQKIKRGNGCKAGHVSRCRYLYSASMRRRVTPSLVISLIALFVALSGASYAAIKLPINAVGTAQIKKDAVTSAKVKDGSLLAGDFKAGQLPAGAKGEAGVKGDTGAAGASGVTAANGTSGSSLGITLTGTPQEVMSTTVSSGPAGRMVVTGSFRMYNQTVAAGGSSCQVSMDLWWRRSECRGIHHQQ